MADGRFLNVHWSSQKAAQRNESSRAHPRNATKCSVEKDQAKFSSHPLLGFRHAMNMNSFAVFIENQTIRQRFHHWRRRRGSELESWKGRERDIEADRQTEGYREADKQTDREQSRGKSPCIIQEGFSGGRHDGLVTKEPRDCLIYPTVQPVP